MTGIVNVGDMVAGKYRIDRVLGIGGMGMVAAATHLELDQRVALKFMLPAAMASPNAVERFLREARAAVRLRSEHVCRVLDVGRLEGGAPYIVMEFMEGQDFAQLLHERGMLEPREAVDYMLQILEGIAEAHANEIVHRDLKPGNVFVATDNDGSPLLKVLDFGISKSSIAGGATKTGDIMGSPSYMAPEQMTSSKHVDGRADIWALGCILYQAVTNELPFTGDTLPALCVAVMTDPPPQVQQIRADLPAGLAAAIMRCLEKKPEARFADVGQLAAAIAPFGSDGSRTVAARIQKVLARRLTPQPVPAIEGGVAPTLVTEHGIAAPPVRAVASARVPQLGHVSTLGACAAELEVSAAPRRSRRGLLVVVASGVSAVIVVAGALALRGDRTPAPAAAPPAAPIVTTPPAVEPAPVAEPPREPVPVAPTVTPPAVATPAEPAAGSGSATTAATTARRKPMPAMKPTRRESKPAAVVEKPVVAVPITPTPTPASAPAAKPADPVPEATPAPAKKWTRMQHDKP